MFTGLKCPKSISALLVVSPTLSSCTPCPVFLYKPMYQLITANIVYWMKYPNNIYFK